MYEKARGRRVGHSLPYLTQYQGLFYRSLKHEVVLQQWDYIVPPISRLYTDFIYWVQYRALVYVLKVALYSRVSEVNWGIRL